jgi:general secretion pathway protein H
MIPTSEIGERGFTLTEMLVVVVIMGLTASVVLATAPVMQLSLTAEAERVAGRLLRAKEEALLTNHVVEVVVTSSGYSFGTLRGGARQNLSEAPFTPVPWIEDTTVNFASADHGTRIIFDPTGLATPAAIDLFRNEGRARIRVDDSGNVTIDAR